MNEPTAIMLDMLVRVVILTTITSVVQALIFGVAGYIVLKYVARSERY